MVSVESSGEKFLVKDYDSTTDESITNFDLGFIPHACHYDENTILNKNGELVQIIKIEDYTFEVSSDRDLRSIVRKSITDNIKIPDFAFWVYTVRKEHKFNLAWQKTGDFSDDLHEIGIEQLKKNKTYINELYIAVVTDTLNESLSQSTLSLSFYFTKNRHKKFLQNKFERINSIVNEVLERLKDFKARRLSLITTEENYKRSELIEFFYYLLTHKHTDCFLDTRDISEIISNFQLSVGFHSFRVLTNQHTSFGSILGIKEYRDSSLQVMDTCLQLDCEFVIVEIIRFVKTKNAVSVFKKQGEMLTISDDMKLYNASSLKEILSTHKNPYTDFCEHKISFMVITDQMAKLGRNIEGAVAALSVIGVMPVIHDLRMEDNFWSHLPGNFPFVMNNRYILTKYSFVFAMLHCFPSGLLIGGRWKEAITIFFSTRGLPYFFNFHVKEKGHALIIGPPKSGRTLLINFILSESRRLNARLIMLDYTGKSVIFIRAMNGLYCRIDYRSNYKGLKFNPLKVEDTKRNREVLVGVFKRIVGLKRSQDENIVIAIKKIVDYVFTLPMESRTFSYIADLVSSLGGNANLWIKGGEFAHLLEDDDNSNFDWQAKILAVNVGVLLNKPECASVILYYFLNYLENHLDGQPTILALDEAWKISSAFSIEKEFDDWVEIMTKLNVVIIFTTENIALTTKSEFTNYLKKHIDTKIFMPNFTLSKLYMKMFSLSKEEFYIMLQIPTHSRHFFIKQNNISSVLTLNLKKSREVNVLSANKDTIRHMYESIEEKGDSSNEWLPLFYEKCAK